MLVSVNSTTFASYIKSTNSPSAFLFYPFNDTVTSSITVPKFVPVIVNNPLKVGLLVDDSRLLSSILLLTSIVNLDDSVTLYPLKFNKITPVLTAGVITTIY
jgi:hypothetical protein